MPDHKKIPIEVVKHFPPSILLKLINWAKDYLKKDEVMQRICEDYGVPVDYIDYIPMMFSDLDVSAKTVKGVIYLNYKLLCDGDFFKDYGYLVHEGTHHFQQCFGDKPTQGSDDGDYLDNKYEIEGFQNQVEYLANEFGEDEAEEYIDNLLKHHEITKKKEKEKKKEELMSLV
jgi:hypothetical protein